SFVAMPRPDQAVSVGEMPERPKGADCKSAGARLRRFESSSPHQTEGGNSSVARASAFQAEGRGFESRFPLQRARSEDRNRKSPGGSVVEHVLGKDGVTGSIPVLGSNRTYTRDARARLWSR